MTMPRAPDRSVLRSRLSGAIGTNLPGSIDRLGWDAGRLAVYQRGRLRRPARPCGSSRCPPGRRARPGREPLMWQAWGTRP
jgi:hypothetical protein